MATLNALIRNAESKSISGKIIQHATNNLCRVVLYSELVQFSSLHDLFEGYPCVILLYQTTDSQHGHWVTLIDHRSTMNMISVYDSYGFGVIDAELAYTKFDKQFETSNGQGLLAKLFQNTQVGYEVNDFRFQKMAQDIQTCGRHAIVRVWNYEKSNREFERFMNGFTPSMTKDKLVTLMTSGTLFAYEKEPE